MSYVPPVIHLVGDTHTGLLLADRKQAFIADLPNLPRAAVHLQVGDLTEDGTPEQEAEAQEILTAMGNWIAIIGNHDTKFGPRSGDAAAASLGLPGKNQSHDLGFCQMICLGHDVHNGGQITLTQETLDYLDAELSACAPKRAIVVAHAPLYNTVVGEDEYQSTEAPMYVIPITPANTGNGVHDQPIRDILASHDNALMWLAGHTHNPISNPTLWVSIDSGPKKLVVGNASAIRYTRPPGAALAGASRLCSLLVYVLRDRIEVRYRDHLNRRATTGPNGQPLTIIYYDDGLVVHERRAA